MFSAIIDNTGLVYLTQLHIRRPIFNRLREIFHTLYIPMAVKDEYAQGLTQEPARSWLLDRLNTEHGFYRLCTSYDTFVNILVESVKGIDKGEAECYSQFKKISAHVLISDDKSFTKAVSDLDKGVKVYNTLHLLCWLDILKYLPTNWDDIIRDFHALRPFGSRHLREAYIEIAAKTGISVDGKMLSDKCSLKRIL